jgi:NAD+ synthase (glutamine-hydrolysing)
MNFIRVSAACPVTNVAHINFNVENIKDCINKAIQNNSKLVVFPELSITSYTCGDLFSQQQLIEKSEFAIRRLCKFSVNKDILIAVGAPLIYKNCLYNCAYIIHNGKILGIVPKSYIPNYSEFYEKRWFTEGINIVNKTINFSFQENIPFGIDLIFSSGVLKFGI